MTISRIWSMLPTQRWKASLQCGAVVSCLPLVLADCVPVSFCPLRIPVQRPGYKGLRSEGIQVSPGLITNVNLQF